MGNYVIAVGNYVIVSPSELGNCMIADTLTPRPGDLGVGDPFAHATKPAAAAFRRARGRERFGKAA